MFIRIALVLEPVMPGDSDLRGGSSDVIIVPPVNEELNLFTTPITSSMDFCLIKKTPPFTDITKKTAEFDCKRATISHDVAMGTVFESGLTETIGGASLTNTPAPALDRKKRLTTEGIAAKVGSSEDGRGSISSKSMVRAMPRDVAKPVIKLAKLSAGTPPPVRGKLEKVGVNSLQRKPVFSSGSSWKHPT